MPFTIYSGPDPAELLTALLDRTPSRRGAVWALVPDTRSAEVLERRMAEGNGGARLGVRAVTMDRLAGEIVGRVGPVPQIVSRHVRRAVLGEMARGRIMPGSTFAAVAGFPGFAEVLAGFLEDVRSRGDGRMSRHPELAAIAAAYDAHLSRMGVTDHEGIVLRALEGDRIERFAVGCDTLLVHGFYDFTDRQFELVRRLVAACHRTGVSIVHDPARPELFRVPGILLERLRSIGGRVERVSARDSAGASEVLAAFGGSSGYPDTVDPRTVRMHAFRSETAETDWIAGTVAGMLSEGGREPADVMIVSRRRMRHGGPLERALQRHGVPREGGFSRQLGLHPLVRLALTAVEAAARPDKPGLVSRVMGSTLVTAEPEDAIGDVADDRNWTSMLAAFDSPPGHAESTLGILEALGIPDVLETVSVPPGAPPLQEVYRRLTEVIGEFGAVYAPFRPLIRAGEYLALLRSFVMGVEIADLTAVGAGVLVTDVTHARYHARPVTIFTGLTQDAVPARSPAFSLYDPDIDAALRERRKAEEPLLFLLSLAGAEEMVLTFPGLDDEGRDDAMSPYLRTIAEGLDGRDPINSHAAVCGSAWEEGAPRGRGTLERTVRALRDDRDEAPLLAAAVKRAGESGTRITEAVAAYHRGNRDRDVTLAGHPSFGPHRERWGLDRVFAVTDLERWLKCPVMFFFERVLGIEEETLVPGDIDPSLRGRIVHDILAGFYRERISAGAPGIDATELTTAVSRIEAITDETFRRYADRLRDLHPVLLDSERRSIAELMSRFLRTEVTRTERDGFVPVLCEVPFGKAANGDDGGFSPLEIDSPEGTVRIGGRIDRVDTVPGEPSPRFRIMDYKTGAATPSFSALERGEVLQVPLYLRAVERIVMAGTALWDGGFYLLRELEYKPFKMNRKPLTGEDWEPFIVQAEARAAEAAHAIADGRFPAPTGGCDRNCPYRALCGGGRDSAEEVDDVPEHT